MHLCARATATEAAVWLRHEVGAHWPPAFVGFMITGAAACWSVPMKPLAKIAQRCGLRSVAEGAMSERTMLLSVSKYLATEGGIHCFYEHAALQLQPVCFVNLQWAIASGSGWRFWQCEHFAPKRYASARMQHQAVAALEWAHANGCPCSCGWNAHSNSSSSSTSNCSRGSGSGKSTQQQHVQLPLLQLVAIPQQQQQQQQWLRLAPHGQQPQQISLLSKNLLHATGTRVLAVALARRSTTRCGFVHVLEPARWRHNHILGMSSLRSTQPSPTPPPTTTEHPPTLNTMTQTATEKAQAGAAKANAQGHAVATDLHAKSPVVVPLKASCRRQQLTRLATRNPRGYVLQGAAAAEQGKGIVASTVDTVTGVAGAVVQKAGDIAVAGRDQAIGLATAAKDIAVNAAVSAKDTTVGVASSARDTSVGAATSARDTAGGAAQGTAGFVQQKAGEAFNAGAGLLGFAQEKAGEVYNAAAAALGVGAQNAEAAADSAKVNAESAAATAQQTGKDAAAQASGAAQSAKASANSAVSTVPYTGPL
eukprot:4586-Heterococcus_DN1.PRE.2